MAVICMPLHALPDKITWVKPQNIHLSLRFLGEVSIELLPKAEAALSQAAKTCTAFSIGFTNTGVFPDVKRPRVIWLGLEDSTARLGRFKQEIDKALNDCGFAPEKRAFKAHLTLGRVRRLKDTKRLISKLGTLVLPELALLEVKYIHLMRSQLRPQGPIYSVLETVQLGG